MKSGKEVIRLIDVRECIQDYRVGFLYVDECTHILQNMGLEISPFEFNMLEGFFPTFPDENIPYYIQKVMGKEELLSVYHQSIQGIENLLYVIPRCLNSYSGEHLLLQSETTSYHILYGLIWRTERLLDKFESEGYFSKDQIYEERIKIGRLIKAGVKSIVYGKNWVDKI